MHANGAGTGFDLDIAGRFLENDAPASGFSAKRSGVGLDPDASGSRRRGHVAANVSDLETTGAARRLDGAGDIPDRLALGAALRDQFGVSRNDDLVADAHVAPKVVVVDLSDGDDVAVLLDGWILFQAAYFGRSARFARRDLAVNAYDAITAGFDGDAPRACSPVELDTPSNLEAALERSSFLGP